MDFNHQLSLYDSGRPQFNSETWLIVKENLKNRSKDSKIGVWLDHVYFVEYQNKGPLNVIILGVSTGLVLSMVLENLREPIFKEIAQVFNADFELDFKVTGHREQDIAKNLSDAFHQKDPQPTSSSPLRSFLTEEPNKVATNNSSHLKLNPNYSFNTFVVGRNSEFAHAACYNVAHNPGSKVEGYNPLFIYGPTGMGKTHLLHAVGNHIKQTQPHLKINYFSAERFIKDVVYHIQNKSMDEFHRKYRHGSDVLLIDDIQLIRGDRSQEEFFHMIDIFLSENRQVIVASDRMPRDISGLEDRIRSRLEWGLLADVQMPDLETRIAITRFKAETLQIKISEDVINYIARISKRSVREIEGSVKKVKITSELRGLPIDLESAKQFLAAHETLTALSPEDVVKMVADQFGIRLTDMKSSTRAKPIVVPRQIAMYLIKKYLDKSLVDIGRMFGGKDHTTVMNAIKRVDFLQEKDVDLKKDIDNLETKIHIQTGL